MDLFLINMSLFCNVFVVAATALKSNQDPSDWLAKSLHAASRRKRSRNQDKKNPIDSDKKSITKEEDKNRCCLNGETCIMNTFCHCKQNFHGRFCEHRVRHRSCGTIRHGTWMASGCHLCHCFDGRMTCKVTTIEGCKKLPYVEGYDNNPDYMIGMDKKVEDYDKVYDEFDYGPEMDFGSGTMGFGVSIRQLTVSIISFIIYKNVLS